MLTLVASHRATPAAICTTARNPRSEGEFPLPLGEGGKLVEAGHVVRAPPGTTVALTNVMAHVPGGGGYCFASWQLQVASMPRRLWRITPCPNVAANPGGLAER